MFFSGQNFNLVIFVDFSVAHVGMTIKSVVPEPDLRFPKPGVAQVLIETSPNRVSRLPNIGGRGTLSLTRQAREFVDGHACSTATFQTVLARAAPFMSRTSTDQITVTVKITRHNQIQPQDGTRVHAPD